MCAHLLIGSLCAAAGCTRTAALEGVSASQDSGYQWLGRRKAKRGAPVRTRRLDERRGVLVPGPADISGELDVVELPANITWLPRVAPGPQIFVHRDDVTAAEWKLDDRGEEVPQRILDYQPELVNVRGSPPYLSSDHPRLTHSGSHISSPVARLLRETKSFALVFAEDTYELGWISRAVMERTARAPTRDAYVLGAGSLPLRRKAGAFLFLLAQQYRTVYINDSGDYANQDTEYQASDYVERRYLAKCPETAQGTKGATHFCDLVPEAPTNLNFDYMNVPAADMPGPIVDADIFAIYPAPNWASGTLLEDLNALVGRGSHAYVATELRRAMSLRRPPELVFVQESLDQSDRMTMADGDQGFALLSLSWEEVTFWWFLTHDGRLVYLLSDYDWVSPGQVSLFRISRNE
ncbi:MAG: hypothetical protein H6715_02035 [Myxococcales bacterium]|nr:hypothetical protein [Myxococcales bacterium]